MMADKRRTSTAEFTREAVHLVTKQGYAVAEAARNLGPNPQMLQRWKRELTEHEHAAFPGNGRVLPAQAELYQLPEENKRLRMERDILKQALGFFASESR
jgi:transposase